MQLVVNSLQTGCAISASNQNLGEGWIFFLGGWGLKNKFSCLQVHQCYPFSSVSDKIYLFSPPSNPKLSLSLSSSSDFFIYRIFDFSVLK
ncbi:hypothetical protein MtrunA17_Chr6g0477481 [Medicago truncatula]|uniref:Uncharacterized protein n=1 Tax=Medicago truncatula TaxID=3880 RepID=A0A396HMT7_MEDTR|nr:hypothetical protein MtrunA17_Chr6g0477481 [Medicago truncatula]